MSGREKKERKRKYRALLETQEHIRQGTIKRKKRLGEEDDR